jgi:ferredoxin
MAQQGGGGQELGESPLSSKGWFATSGNLDKREQPLGKETDVGEASDDSISSSIKALPSCQKTAQPPPIAKGLKPGMVVTIRGGPESKFCTPYTLKCSGKYPEIFTITDAGNGYFGLIGGSEGASTTPESAQLSFMDAGDGKVALKMKGDGRCCTGSATKGMTCEASQITAKEMFTIREEKSSASSTSSKKKGNSCKTTSNLKAQALCPFSPELWNLGATCISNHVHGDKHPQCPDGASAKVIATIKTLCRKADSRGGDDQKCSRLGMSY